MDDEFFFILSYSICCCFFQLHAFNKFRNMNSLYFEHIFCRTSKIVLKSKFMSRTCVYCRSSWRDLLFPSKFLRDSKCKTTRLHLDTDDFRIKPTDFNKLKPTRLKAPNTSARFHTPVQCALGTQLLHLFNLQSAIETNHPI